MLKVDKAVTYILLLLFILSSFSFVLPGCSEREPEAVEQEQEQPEEEEIEEEEVQNITVKKVQPITVVINNHPSARPQSGLQQASVVYEFLVEGGLSRFLAVYDTPYNNNFMIGPVRSLRPYLGVKAAEYGGLIAHSGYSRRTEMMIRGLNLKQIVSSAYLFRDSSRRAPHNLYTDIEKLHKAAGGDPAVTEREIIIEKNNSLSFEEGSQVEIVYSAGNQVFYTYDDKEEVYLRFINSVSHKDRDTGKQYYARRVIVQHVSHQYVPGTDLVDIDLEGSGEGLLYEEGRKYSLNWEKKDGTTNYYYEDSTPVELGWGSTWIQIVR